MYRCYSCHQQIELRDRVGREEACPHCDSHLHCCLNCRFYEPASYNECHEPVAERVVDKEQANFCDWFEISDRALTNGINLNDTKKKLEMLFKKE